MRLDVCRIQLERSRECVPGFIVEKLPEQSAPEPKMRVRVLRGQSESAPQAINLTVESTFLSERCGPSESRLAAVFPEL